MIPSLIVFVSPAMLYRSFVELSHFHASLSTSSILNLFPDESHIPSIVALDPPIDFSIQTLDIFILDHPLMNRWKMNRLKPPSPELGSPTSASPEDLAHYIPLHHSTWVRSIPANSLNYHCYTTLATLYKPHTYHKASTNHLWQIAMKEELDALSKNHTRDLVTLPPGSLWLVVSGSTGSRFALIGPLSTLNLILLQKGFTQEYRIDYEETFASVARISSVRALLAVAATRKWDFFRWMLKMLSLMGS